MSNLREAAQQALEALEDPWKAGAEGVADAITALKAALAEPQIEDPAIHFCHRFAILMECMVLSNDSNLDKYWDEAHALLDGYNAARDKWMEAQGQPYVSGFGKD